MDSPADLHEKRQMNQRFLEIQRKLDIYIPTNPLKGSGAAFLLGILGRRERLHCLRNAMLRLFGWTCSCRMSAQLTLCVRESGVSASTVRSYYQLLRDTLMGFELEPWRKKSKRRVVQTLKFYLFDIGVANALNPEVSVISEGNDVFGRAFEHFVINEIRSFLSYSKLDMPLAYWRTSSGLDVDLVAGAAALLVECKASASVRQNELKGIRTFLEEHKSRRHVVVTREHEPRRTEDGIELIPWRQFCKMLWAGELIRG